MSIFRKSSVADFTRGGQTTIHFFRMIKQVVKEYARWCGIAFILVLLSVIYLKTSKDDLKLTEAWAEAWVKYSGLTLYDSSVFITFPDGKERQVKSSLILKNRGVFDAVEKVYNAFLYGVCFGLAAIIVAIYVSMKFIYSTGKSFAKDEFVRGGRLVSAPELSKIVRQKKDTRGITIADIPIPYESEPAHILIAGSPGTGKSVTYRDILAAIRKRGERAIVYDPSGELTENFFREGKDILLNPMDVRAVAWDVWSECQRDYDYEKVASSLIPDTKKGDPFWTLGARIVFSAITRKMAEDPARSNSKLYETIMKLSLKDIIAFVKDTEGTAIIDENGEKVAQSIRAILATYVLPFRYLQDGRHRFSIRKWINDEEADSWVFITGKDDQSDIIRPLASVWLDIAASSILSLRPSRDRRIWGMIDELASLQKLTNLLNTLAQARKYGGCFVLGIQGYPQLCGIYGDEEAEAIAGVCSTWAVFRFNDSKSAKWASEGLGKIEQLETQEGISYGVNDIRDGVSINRQRQSREIVIPTEIQFLEDLHGYLKLGRNFPVASFVAKRKKYPVLSIGYIDRFKSLEEDPTYIGSGFTNGPMTGENTTQIPKLRKEPVFNEEVTVDTETGEILESTKPILAEHREPLRSEEPNNSRESSSSGRIRI